MVEVVQTAIQSQTSREILRPKQGLRMTVLHVFLTFLDDLNSSYFTRSPDHPILLKSACFFGFRCLSGMSHAVRAGSCRLGVIALVSRILKKACGFVFFYSES